MRRRLLRAFAAIATLSLLLAPRALDAQGSAGLLEGQTLFSIPAGRELRCTIVPRTAGIPSFVTTIVEFSIPGAIVESRTTRLLLDSAGTALRLIDMEFMPRGESEETFASSVVAFLGDSAGGIVFMSIASKTTMTQPAPQPPRELTRSEAANARALAKWLLARRCGERISAARSVRDFVIAS